MISLSCSTVLLATYCLLGRSLSYLLCLIPRPTSGLISMSDLLCSTGSAVRVRTDHA
jgi:hypothetical protein